MNTTKTYEKFKTKPADNKPKWLIIHHTGGNKANPLLDTSNQTPEIIENYHLSLGWEGVGYHFLITKKGDLWLGRPEQYHGAHTLNYNTLSLGICLIGNFDLTLPTPEQIKTLTELLKSLRAKYPNIAKEQIVPHRKFSPTSCYGNKLKDTWASELIIQGETLHSELKALILKYE